ncbi:hypothetical protein P280DRAFT_484703 [Massarina eburnea CBS 473.64]|uniref:Uncharacterized protein n=1 Tax=Massarina eburnea CBS 473.64 TaxID=1395130 RepID=A0A6A6RJE6_9PLEO|nr:hypothetical protein P280DRAFT_484703 [Massarina eburnea CBS 473.64]
MPSSRSDSRTPSYSSTTKPASLQSFIDKIRPRSSSTSRPRSPSKPRIPSITSPAPRSTSKSRVFSTTSDKLHERSKSRPCHVSTSSQATRSTSFRTSSLSVNKPLPPLPPLPISPTPVRPTFKPIRSMSAREGYGYGAPDLGTGGWGTKDWTNLKAVAAEREWMAEQKKAYAGQERIYKEVVGIREGRGEEALVSGEQKWEMEFKKMNIGTSGARKENDRREEMVGDREGREKRRGDVVPKEPVAVSKGDLKRNRMLEKQLEMERRWAEHPPTPLAWPGQGESDDEWDFDSPPVSARSVFQ